MSIVSKLLRVFNFTPKQLPLNIVDADQLYRDLPIDEWARQSGEQNEPPTSSGAPDTYEHRIRAHALTLIAGVNKEYGDKLQAAQVEREQLRSRFGARAFDDLVDQTRFHLDTLRANAAVALKRLWRVSRHQLAVLRGFRSRHGLTRDAEYPANLSHFYAGLAIATLIEGLANSFLFAVGSQRGWLGGLWEALTIAALNVILSYQVGAALRGINKPGWRRATATALGVLFIAGLVIFHGAVGHYRAALAGPSPDTAVTTAIATLTTDPLGALADLHSWMLILVGGLATVGAAVAGYKSDDPFPGYGKVDRYYRKALREYEAASAAYRDGIQADGGNGLLAVDDQLSDAQRSIEEYRANTNATREMVAGYQMLAQGIAAACVGAIQRYRKVNMDVRVTLPPTYFHEMPVPIHGGAFLDIALLTVAAPEDVAESFRKVWAQARQSADAVRKEIRNLTAQRLGEVPQFVLSIEQEVDGVALASPPLQIGHQDAPPASTNSNGRDEPTSGPSNGGNGLDETVSTHGVHQHSGIN